MIPFRCKKNPLKQIVIGLLTAITTIMISSAVLAATNYQLTQTPRFSLSTDANGQDLAAIPPRATIKARRKTVPSSPLSNPKLVGQQLYQALTQNRAALASRKTPKINGVQSTAIIEPAQQQNLKSLNLQLKDSGGVKVSFDTSKGTPTFIKPNNVSIKPNITGLTTAKPSKSAIAMQFLKDNRALLKLENPEAELQTISQATDAQNKTHIRFQQTIQGVPVWGKQALVHLDKDDGVYLFQGRYQPTLTSLNVTPNITAQAAIDKVLQDLEFTGVLPEPANTELVVYTASSGSSVLTFKVEVSPTIQDRWIYFIDAATAAIVHKIYNTHKNVVQASGDGLDNELRTFNVWDAQNGTYYLIDPDTPTAGGNADPVADGPRPTGDTYILDAQNGDGSQLFFNTHNALTNWPDHVAVSAAYNTRLVYEYYLNTFGRNSIDGNNKNLMVVIHFENGLDNAFWNGTFMVYGDGGDIFSPLAGCLDVAGHETTHGVIESSAGLIYENQSGALNESFADVFGAMIDNDEKNNNDNNSDWKLGENCTMVNPFYLRNMANPPSGLGGGQPAHMDDYQNLPNTQDGDNGGVHINSGIPNRAAYLIAEGLTNEGLGTSIGRAQTQQIYYLALTNYLTQSAQFIDARRALIQAAEDLHGANSTQTQAVADAFDAVGVSEGGGAPAPTPPDTRPTPTDPVAGDEQMVYLSPNNSSGKLELYVQTMDDPFTGYNINADYGPYNYTTDSKEPAASYTKPAALTDAFGTFYYYVSDKYDIYEAVLDGPDIQQTFTSGDPNTPGIYSIAISPNGRYVAYTTSNGADNNIYVIDYDAGGTIYEFPVVPEDYQGGSTVTGNTIFYADALAFDYSSSLIVFDALNCLSTQVSSCSDSGGGYQYWSIGILDVTTGQFFFPIANQSPAFDLGFPSFAANNNYVIALDLQDKTNSTDLTTVIDSEAITIDFENQQINTVHDFGVSDSTYWSVPTFWGNDNFVTMQAPAITDTNAGISASRISINQQWQGSSNLQEINPKTVLRPIMHRTGQRSLNGRLTPNVAMLDFGDVPPGESSQRSVTFSNPGNSDVNITNITTNNSNFTHNGVNTRVPRGQSITITVDYFSTRSGTDAGSLVISHDGESGTTVVSLVANGDNGSNQDSGGGGGNVFGMVILLLVALFAVPGGLRSRRTVSRV
jgi:Zn-dependent metalloprotease